MTRDQFIAHTAALARKLRQHLTAKQSVAIAERIAAQEDQGPHPLWAYSEGTADTRDVLVARKIELAAEQAPELFRVPPTAEQYVQIQLAGKKEPPTFNEQMNLKRNVDKLTPDQLLEKVPPGTPLPEIKAPTQISAPLAKPTPSDVDALDAEVERRTGRKAADLLPSQRRAYHDKIKAEMRRDASSEQNREAAAASVNDDLSALPPAMRMTRFRAAEKAKKNRA